MSPTQTPLSPLTDVTSFIETFFDAVKKRIEQEELFFKKLSLAIVTSIDYIKMMRFLRTAYNMIGELDSDILRQSIFLNKLFKDCDSLYEMYSHRVAGTILFETQFLNNLKPYKKLEQDLEKAKELRLSHEQSVKLYEEEIKAIQDKKDPSLLPQLRQIKDKLADSVHEYATYRDKAMQLSTELDKIRKLYKELFIPRFEKQQREYSTKLTLLLNKKLCLLEKVLSHEASQSKVVEEFFIKANITGEFSIKLFIKSYIRNINTENSQDNEWHNYLKNIIKSMD